MAEVQRIGNTPPRKKVPNSMETRKLEVFCKVVELKSFTRAAEAVLLSQPTVSEHIRNLEQELNQKLLDRLGQEVVPTSVGNLLYEYACKILQTHREAVEAIEKYSGRLIGKIAIGCGTIPGTYVLPELINQFRQAHPAIKTTLRINSSRIIAEQVLTEKLGLGVVGAKWNDSGLQWEKIFIDELILAAHPDHPWTHKKSINLGDIFSEPFILREQDSGTRRVIAQFLKANGFKETDLQEIAEIGSTAAIKESIKLGLGVSILSRRAIMDNITFGTIATIPVKGFHLQRPFYLVKRKNKALPPVAAAFYDYLLAQADKE